MNLIAAAISIAALVNTVSALITFNLPTPGTLWYTKTANYLNIVSHDPTEQYATVRFATMRECSTLTVRVNSVIPITLPRQLRSTNYLNIYAISNLNNMANTVVSVVDSLCATAAVTSDISCANPCARRRGCTFYASESNSESEQASESEQLVYIAHDSEAAKALQQAQEQAVAHLAEDILAVEKEIKA